MKRLSPYDSLEEFSGITPGRIPGLDGMKISNPKLTVLGPPRWDRKPTGIETWCISYNYLA